MTAGCEAPRVLRPGGPARVPLRVCCVAALIRQGDPVEGHSSVRGWFCPAEDVVGPAPAVFSAPADGAAP